MEQRNFLVMVSLCPGTRAGAKIPGQTPFPVLEHPFPVLERPFPVLECLKMLKNC